MNHHIIRHPEYCPNGVFYGFIGKNTLISDCKYRGVDKEAQGNRKKIISLINANDARLSILEQVHGSKCVVIDSSNNPEEIKADGQVTNCNDVVLGVQTADCVPILFIDSKYKIIGAVHAGWRGALSGIIESTVEKMQGLSSKERNIDIVIGPAIQQQSYEVDESFFQKFINHSKENKQCFYPSQNEGHYMFDLPGYVIKRLSRYNFNNIFNVNMNTFTDEKLFFSYRRSTLRREKLDGHILSIVFIKDCK